MIRLERVHSTARCLPLSAPEVTAGLFSPSVSLFGSPVKNCSNNSLLSASCLISSPWQLWYNLTSVHACVFCPSTQRRASEPLECCCSISVLRHCCGKNWNILEPTHTDTNANTRFLFSANVKCIFIVAAHNRGTLERCYFWPPAGPSVCSVSMFLWCMQWFSSGNLDYLHGPKTWIW